MPYNSNEPPKSKIAQSTYINRLNAIFGFTTVDKSKARTSLEKNHGIKLVKVDLANPAYRIKQAAIGSVYQDTKFGTTIEKYFDSYLHENTISYSDIVDRQIRLNELDFMYYNDNYVSKAVKQTANEATQIDVQDRLISVESPNIAFVQRCYELFSIWGVTQQRIWDICRDLQLYGEAFWANRSNQKTGISKISHLSPKHIMEKLEFSPAKMAEYLAARDNGANANRSRSEKLQKLVNMLNSPEAFDIAENFADIADSKIFGYELHDGNVVPPWVITHFRLGSGDVGDEFFPYGRSPMLDCLAPFKQAQSVIALDGIARMMNFPLTLYKVKVPEGTPPGKAARIVEETKESFDNTGVTPISAGSELYTVNSKIWIADGLLDVTVLESKVDLETTDKLDWYAKRVASATDLALGILDPSADSSHVSGIAWKEQNKPFARQVYEIQSAFLQGLGELIRLHFAITGEYDYNTPFILSMRYPASEMSNDQRDARNASIELSKSVVDLIKQSLSLEDSDTLPQDVIEDILSKYSFLDPTDIQKWLNRTAFIQSQVPSDDESGDNGGDLDFGDDSGGDLGLDTGSGMGEDDSGGDLGLGESNTHNHDKHLYNEHQKFLKQKLYERQCRFREAYNSLNESIYFKFLERNGFSSWSNPISSRIYTIVPKITENSAMFETFKVIDHAGPIEGYTKLQESFAEKEKDKVVSNIPVNTVPNEKISEAIENSNLGNEVIRIVQ